VKVDASLLRRILPTLAVVLAALVALAAHFTAPRIDRLARLRAERAQLTEQAVEREDASPTTNFVAAHQLDEIAPLTGRLQALNEALADPNASYDVLAELIRRSGLEIESAAPGRAEAVDDRFEVFAWNVIALGSFDETTALLDSLHELPGLTRLASMRLGPAAAGKRPGDLMLHLNVEFVRVLIPARLADAAADIVPGVEP